MFSIRIEPDRYESRTFPFTEKEIADTLMHRALRPV